MPYVDNKCGACGRLVMRTVKPIGRVTYCGKCEKTGAALYDRQRRKMAAEGGRVSSCAVLTGLAIASASAVICSPAALLWYAVCR